MRFPRPTTLLGVFLPVAVCFTSLSCGMGIGLDAFVSDDDLVGDGGQTWTTPGEGAADDDGGEADENVEPPRDTQALCQEAVAHLASCGVVESAPSPCGDDAADEAELLLELTCDEMNASMDSEGPLPLCTWFGWNCDAFYECGGQVLAKDYTRLLKASDVANVDNLQNAIDSLDEVADAFSRHYDLRGLLPVFARPALQELMRFVQQDKVVDRTWASAYALALVSPYLANLRLELTAQNTEFNWERYYDLTADCTSSPMRIAALGLTSLLVVDMPRAVETSLALDENKEDFMGMGEQIRLAKDDMVQEVWVYYGAEGAAFMQGFFVGDWSEGSWGGLATSSFSLDTLLAKGWKNGLWLLTPGLGWIADAEMWNSWRAMDGLLATMDQSGSL